MNNFKSSWIVVIVILIILGGVGYVWMFKSKSETALSQDLHVKDVPVLGREHVKVGTKVEYSSNPPTSGEHFEVWTKSGVYDKPTEDGHLVHSLEHGYVIISHNCEIQNKISNIKDQKDGTKSAGIDNKNCKDFVEKLEGFVREDSWKMILIPRPSLDTDFALTAWGKIDKFNIQDASINRVNAFKEAFRSQGPEQTME
ncbi:DUF3105 domain-containing protein [Candidatus Roizmanbacteria bacterium]|nr:DUF3105 domain-containing protein [Candidatus Roizmanbacteria bacterium]